mgnify:CR=1 FL=1
MKSEFNGKAVDTMKYKDNMDVLNNGTEEEKKIVLESFMYWLQNYTSHQGLVYEWLAKEPKTNCYGEIILG